MMAPHAGKPAITCDAVMLGLVLGAKCPYELANLFGVGSVNLDLVETLSALARGGAIRATEHHRHPRSPHMPCTRIRVPATLASLRVQYGLHGLSSSSDTLDT